ncbi:MAG: hypothetical protein FalmKO_32830 [Falsiruegeria mediterranea]
MHPRPVEHEPKGGLSASAGMKRAQERIFDPQEGGIVFRCHGAAPMRRWAVAPNTNQIIIAGKA